MVKISRLKKLNILTKISRLRKVAEWTQINMADPDLFQKITDSITYGYPVQINYQGSGWRTIQPYGWNTSKQKSNGDGGNVLLMCYKDTGELRSYRLDKIEDLYIDYDNQVSTTNNPQMADDEQTQIYEDIMNDQSKEDLDMPTLPEDNEVKQEPPGVYDQELSMLSDDITPQNVQLQNPTIDNSEPINQEVDNIPQDNNTEDTVQENIPQENIEPESIEQTEPESNQEQPVEEQQDNENNNEEEENKNE